MIKFDKSFNLARVSAFHSFNLTLESLRNQPNISELDFLLKWQEYLTKEENIFAIGWYSPPPYGSAVLFGDRISFRSLRDEENWPGNRVINWNEDVLYAYTSPVDKQTGLIGDMSITLYLGNNKEIIKHFQNCHNAIMEIFKSLLLLENSVDLFNYSQIIFEKYGLTNNIISTTNNGLADIGHTLPFLKDFKKEETLSEEDRLSISKDRKFVSGNNSWIFEEGLSFTFEPRLISLTNPNLPQVSQHYIIKKTDNDFLICNDIDDILKEYKLI